MITGKKINLRVIEERDLETLITLESDISNKGEFSTPFIQSAVHFKKSFHEHGFWQRDSARMLITDKEDHILGKIQYFKSYKYSTGVELGASIYKAKDRSKGYVSEAVKLFCEYLYEGYRIDRIEISTEPDNIAAQKTALKAGFVYEGTRRNACFTKGKLVDLQMYSLLRGELIE